jgi:ubiquinone/menaquinone biosynthesis C-methylase UbiE
VKPHLRTRVNGFPQYVGSDWDRKINSPDNPNFWKFGVADLIFLEWAGEKKHVLDLGCGTGGSTLFLASKGKAQLIIGVDLLRNMIEVAKKRASDSELADKICFVVCDGRRLPFINSFFDGLVSRGDAFCFLVPLEATVRELKRIMKPRGVIALEIDNYRANWKPGTTISTGFVRMSDGKIAYTVAKFTKNRDYNSVSYVLDPDSMMAKQVAEDRQFQKTGRKTCVCAIEKVKRETVEVMRSALTHWSSASELAKLIKRGGFKKVRVIGDGLFMNLLLHGDPEIAEAMKKSPQLFFRIERRLVPYMRPSSAPTIILRAVAS